MVHYMADPPRFDAYQPRVPPSETVHISPAKSESGTVLSGGQDYWAALGFTLKGLLMEVYRVHESYLDLAQSLDTDVRYDVELVLPGSESSDQVIGRIQRAIGQQLQIDVSRHIRSMDVYVLTAPDEMASSGPFGDMAGGGVFASSWRMEDIDGVPPTLADLQSGGAAFVLQLVQHLPAIGKGFAHLDRFLPFSCGLLIVDEVEREGYHAIEISCMGRRTTEKLCRALWDDLGIVATHERRDVEMLIARQSSTPVQ
jgi:uncharacterized protein (TIGR03435 family)